MKKYGKYEKRPEVVPEKQPKAKSPLLQTYLTSLLCMVLSVTMFFGTSFAWFTSEVNNVGNEIYIGTLDVELEKKTGDTTWASLSALTNGVNTTKLFDGQIRWEPGYTMLETVRVTNQGDLAFNYELNFTDGTLGTDEAADIAEIAEHFDIWVYHTDDNTIPDLTKYSDISEENGWDEVGALAEVLAGKAVFAGKMEEATVRYENEETSPTNPGTTDGMPTAHTYTIALHMREDATGEGLMGKKISLNVKLIAYQMSSEPDSIAATEGYDKVAAVSNLKEFEGVSGNVVLTSDITIKADDAVTNVEIPGGIYLDGNGKTVSFAEDVENGTVIIACEKVYNLTVKAQVNAAANVVLSNCAFDKLVLNDNIETVTLINSKIGNNTVERAVLTVSVDENGNRTWNSDNNLVSVNNKSVSVANNSN